MSLLTFVKRPDVKAYLRENVPQPPFQMREEIKAPALTKSYGLTGTAFDYALRFYLQKLNPSAKSKPWVAETGANLVFVHPSFPSEVKERVQRIMEIAKECVHSYLKSKRDAKPGPDLIRTAIVLAQLDLVVRAQQLDLQPINDAMVEDITNMLALVRPEEFRAKRTCALNPTFGMASKLVGGADGDLFIDDTLIDIKATKDLKMDRDMFNQLVGYYCLSSISGIDGCRGKVTCVAVYFARYGILHRMPVNSFVGLSRLPALLKWFEATARRGV